jgi:hypothetical protein
MHIRIAHMPTTRNQLMKTTSHTPTNNTALPKPTEGCILCERRAGTKLVERFMVRSAARINSLRQAGLSVFRYRAGGWVSV